MRDLGLEHVEALRARIDEGQGGASLPGGLRMLLGESHFEIAVGRPALPPLGGPDSGVPLQADGVTTWPGGWRFRSALRDRLPSDLSSRDAWRAVVDADSLGAAPTIRARRPGDRFQPAGMGGHHKSLQDLFVDGRVPQHMRSGWPILSAGDRILWVPGLRIDERARLRPTTRRIYVIEVDAPEEARQAVG
jgi:tRNA(Ile)-lysidine synthase